MHLFKAIIQVLFICLALLKAISSTPYYYKALDGREYLIETDKKYNWYQAWHECARRNLQLTVIDSQAKNLNIIDLLKKVIGKSSNLWLGGNDEFSSKKSVTRPFYWAATGKRIVFSYWSDNQPDNNRKNEHCAHIWDHKSAYKWNDIDCTEKMGFICEINHYVETCNKNLKNKCDGVIQSSSSISEDFVQKQKQQQTEIDNKIQSTKSVLDDWKIEIQQLQNSTQAAVQKLLNNHLVSVQQSTEKMLNQLKDLDEQLRNSTIETNSQFGEKLNEKQNEINKIC
ncbi:lectin subunit alpha-like [Lucilia sericata]|uniref:lectin subunit alpha-like n=1 Tax=Lucilia sericata TaxID=13632 RepID=UPI0018A8402B|nr:lectin subunit alpha-like [Lucilia sericata]